MPMVPDYASISYILESFPPSAASKAVLLVVVNSELGPDQGEVDTEFSHSTFRPV